MKTFLVVVIVAYILYILLIRPIVVAAKYGKDKTGSPLPEAIDDIALFELLREKGFAYPEMKNMYYNEGGQVVIEGKFTSHALTISEQRVYVDRGLRGNQQKKTLCILEAVSIGHYLTKFFNPKAPINAYKQYKSFKNKRKQPLMVVSALVILFIVFAAIGSRDTIVPQIKSNNISESYLSQYSSTETIGDTFAKFFGNPKWKSYEQGIQKYVDFQGSCTVNDQPATAVITFSVLGDQFQVESVKLNNDPLNPIEIENFFKTVYGS